MSYDIGGFNPPFCVYTLHQNFAVSNPNFHTQIWTSWLLHFLLKPPPPDFSLHPRSSPRLKVRSRTEQIYRVTDSHRLCQIVTGAMFYWIKWTLGWVRRWVEPRECPLKGFVMSHSTEDHSKQKVGQSWSYGYD